VVWTVRLTSKARRQIEQLPEPVRLAYLVLANEMSAAGPYRHNWSHYGKLRGSKNTFHCHLISGRPTYVACWEVKDKSIYLIEVYYVGTHENAPY
jgi:mRNA-degrading endonuclease RelE of RelBE toxin-antitoxin system